MSNFSIVPIEVAMDSRLSKNQIRVLIALLSFRKDKSTFVVWPSRREISARSGLPESRISEITTKLKALKWITKIGKGGFSKSTQYKITVPDLVTVTKPVTVTGSVKNTVTGSVTRIEETIEETKESLSHAHERKNYQGTSTTIPDDFHVTEIHRAWAKQLGAPDPELYIETFIAHHQSKGTLSVNWDAEFRKWMSRERAYAMQRAHSARPYQGNATPSHQEPKRPRPDLVEVAARQGHGKNKKKPPGFSIKKMFEEELRALEANKQVSHG